MPEQDLALETELRERRNAIAAESQARSDAAGAQFVADVERALEPQRTPPAEGAARMDALTTALDAAIRQRWGPLPWVRYTRPGRVLSVNAAAHTCKVRIAEDSGPTSPDASTTRTVRTGVGVPQVGKTYAVHFPYTLPEEPTALLTGPVPAGDPWLKAPAGQTWLYYLGVGATSSRNTLWRVALPGPAPFLYTPEMATNVHTLPSRPDVLNPGDMHVAGPGMVTQTLYLEESAFERFGRPEDAPVTYPYPLRLHRYPHFGADGTEAAVQVSNLPHAHALWTNMGEGLLTDRLLGSGRRTEEEPNLTPFAGSHYYHQLADLLTSPDGGATWATVRSGLLLQRQIFYYYPAGGFYVAGGGYVDGDTRLLNAAGWVADADIPGIGNATEAIDTWMGTYWAGGNPYPSDIAPVPLEGDRPIQYKVSWWQTNQVRAQLYVSRNGGSPALYDFAQPPGWVTQCYLRPSGGGGLRGWWQGHDQQFVVLHPIPNNPGTFFIEYGASADALWYGERPADGTWQWRPITTPAGLNRIIHCNGDGSVALVARFVGPDPVRDIDSHWLTTDAGTTWRELPIPPYFLWDPAHGVSYAMQGWLIDTP